MTKIGRCHYSRCMLFEVFIASKTSNPSLRSRRLYVEQWLEPFLIWITVDPPGEAGHPVAEMYLLRSQSVLVSPGSGQSAIGYERRHIFSSTSHLVPPSLPPHQRRLGWFSPIPGSLICCSPVWSGQTSWRSPGRHAFLFCHLSLELKCSTASYFGSSCTSLFWSFLSKKKNKEKEITKCDVICVFSQIHAPLTVESDVCVDQMLFPCVLKTIQLTTSGYWVVHAGFNKLDFF